MSTLAALGCAMGVLLILFLVGIHFLVLEANTRSPARLDESAFMVVLVGFLLLLALWIGALALRFGRPASGSWPDATMSAKKSFLLRVDPELWAEVERLAQAELRSANAQVEFLLRDALVRRGVRAARRPRPSAQGRRRRRGRMNAPTED